MNIKSDVFTTPYGHPTTSVFPPIANEGSVGSASYPWAKTETCTGPAQTKYLGAFTDSLDTVGDLVQEPNGTTTIRVIKKVGQTYTKSINLTKRELNLLTHELYLLMRLGKLS